MVEAIAVEPKQTVRIMTISLLAACRRSGLFEADVHRSAW